MAAELKALLCSAIVNRPATGVAHEVLKARAFAVSFCLWCAVMSAPSPLGVGLEVRHLPPHVGVEGTVPTSTHLESTWGKCPSGRHVANTGRTGAGFKRSRPLWMVSQRVTIHLG